MSQAALKEALSKTVKGIQDNPVMSRVVFEAQTALVEGVRCGGSVRGFPIRRHRPPGWAAATTRRTRSSCCSSRSAPARDHVRRHGGNDGASSWTEVKVQSERIARPQRVCSAWTPPSARLSEDHL